MPETRYKIKAITDDSFRDLLELLEGRVRIFVRLPRRRLLGTGEIPPRLRGEVEAHGGEISEDEQYTLEGGKAPCAGTYDSFPSRPR
jgi:hypothetical protein